MLKTEGTFISQKINKIRWIHEEFGTTEHFITGSWDDVDCDSLKVWHLRGNENSKLPMECAVFKIDGDVTEIKYVNEKRLAVSTSEGDTRIFQITVHHPAAEIKELYAWKKLHSFGLVQCSCTSLDTYEGELVTVGEDGAINLLDSHRGGVLRSLKDVDSCGIHCVSFIKHTEVMTGNIRGHMKMFDLRADTDKPTASFLLSGDEQAANCLVRHPTKPFIVLAGSESGSIAIWDLRMESYPSSLVSAHSGAVKELGFHHENSQKLLSCSTMGEFWEWNMDAMAKSTKGNDDKIAWMPVDDNSVVKANAIISNTKKGLNSFDCDKSRILVGGENEVVFHLRNYRY